MKLLEYNLIINFVEEHSSKCPRTVLSSLVAKYKEQYPHHTLLSIFLNRLQRKLKATYHLKTKKENLKLYYGLFTQRMIAQRQKHPSVTSDDKVLINLAIQFDLPPCLMARLVLDQYLLEERLTQVTSNGGELIMSNGVNSQSMNQNSGPVCNGVSEMKLSTVGDHHGVVDTVSNPNDVKVKGSQYSTMEKGANSQPQSTKSQVSMCMKDPYLIPDVFLRDQILQCVSYDICYGPINDAIRHSVGLEFEEKLKKDVGKLDLPFLDENDLRKRGYDKTPDVKLEVPIAVRGHPVCWIESKASFGDLETHSEYLHGQYYSYWNRFGPGLVIYWFGFIEEISEDMLKKGILIMDGFPNPDDITFMNP